MATKYKHFKGKYLGYFSPDKPQHVHAFTFQDLQWESIEIKDIEAIEDRVIDSEKVGDYIYMPVLKTRSKSKLKAVFQKGIDVVIIGKDEQAYSEDLYQVIMRRQGGNRLGEFQPVRESGMVKINEHTFCSTGEIRFSIPDGEIAKPVKTLPITPTSNVEIPIVTTPQHEINVIPDLVINPTNTTRPNFPNSTVPKVGCLGMIGKLLKWYFIFALIYGLFMAISGWAKKSGDDNNRFKTDEGAVQEDKPRLNPNQDTLAPMPWDYLTDHRIEWSDFISHRYLAKYSTSSKSFEDSQRLHAPWANPQTNNAMSFWNGLYSSFSSHDSEKLDSLTQYFNSERQRNAMDAAATAEMVITFIQEIPYCLVHDGSCNDAIKMGGFVQEYHQANKPCLPQIIAGVQTPYEFIHNLKGDCDTRSLLGFSLLSRLGIPASIWVSEEYGHSVMGVGVPGPIQNVKMVNGFRHAGVELTSKGFRLGMLSPAHTNMNNWDVVLYKNP